MNSSHNELKVNLLFMSVRAHSFSLSTKMPEHGPRALERRERDVSPSLERAFNRGDTPEPKSPWSLCSLMYVLSWLGRLMTFKELAYVVF